MRLWKNDAQQHVFAESQPSKDYWEVEMVFEGALPASMTDEQITEWLKGAQLVAGLWAGPRPEPQGDKP